MASVEPTYWNDHSAALGLAEGLRTIRRIEKESQGYWDRPPYHVTQERDRAVADVKAAIRYLCTDEDDEETR